MANGAATACSSVTTSTPSSGRGSPPGGWRDAPAALTMIRPSRPSGPPAPGPAAPGGRGQAGRVKAVAVAQRVHRREEPPTAACPSSPAAFASISGRPAGQPGLPRNAEVRSSTVSPPTKLSVTSAPHRAG